MIRVALAATPAAMIIVFVLMFFSPLHAFAATCGLASHYGSESGSITANGEHFRPAGLTAASKTLPFGTVLEVTMLDPRPRMKRFYGRKVTVRINDRGPYIAGRFLDLSTGAATRIGLTTSGVSRVCIEPLHPP